jgi:hypothetical protein
MGASAALIREAPASLAEEIPHHREELRTLLAEWLAVADAAEEGLAAATLEELVERASLWAANGARPQQTPLADHRGPGGRYRWVLVADPLINSSWGS